jgi:hypothetical protein
MTENLGAKSFVRLEFSASFFHKFVATRARKIYIDETERSVDEELVNKMDNGKINRLNKQLSAKC